MVIISNPKIALESLNNTMDIKISQLPASAQPLIGNELVPIVRSGVTVNTPVSAIGSGGISSGEYLPLSGGTISGQFLTTGQISTSAIIIGTTYSTHIHNALASQQVSIGYNSGLGATGAYNTVLIGSSAGRNAINAHDSVFMGNQCGLNATNAYNSNFLGSYSGWGAASANNSNFFGYFSGYNATNANNSNFLGYEAGYNATNANNSNFLGGGAGRDATGASFSNFLGGGAGAGVTGSKNQLIGASTSVNPLSCSNCIVLGDRAVATQSNTIAIGSTTTPLLTASSATGSTGSYLVVRINGVDRKLLIYT